MMWYALLHMPAHAVDTRLLAAFTQVTPRLARTPSGVMLDLGSGTALMLHQLAHEALGLAARATRTEAAVGVATSRCVATLAAYHTPPSTVRLITPDAQHTFLAPLLVANLPVAPALLQRLQRCGLATVGQIAAIPLATLQAQFGARGSDLFDLAHGRDRTPFVPEPIAPTVQLRQSFAAPLADWRDTHAVLDRLVTRLCQRLMAGGWAAGALILTVECDDGVLHRAMHTLVQPTTHERLIGQHVRALLYTLPLRSVVTALGMVVPHLVPQIACQLSLVPPERGTSERRADLVAALAPHMRMQLIDAQIAAPDAYLPEHRVTLRLGTPV